MLARLAKEKGFQKMTADVLPSNEAMLNVLKKGKHPSQAKIENGIYELTIDLTR